jgi:hypothetical protein
MSDSKGTIKDPEAEALELQAALRAVGESFRTAVAKVSGGKVTFGQFKALQREKSANRRPLPARG